MSYFACARLVAVKKYPVLAEVHAKSYNEVTLAQDKNYRYFVKSQGREEQLLKNAGFAHRQAIIPEQTLNFVAKRHR